ncbi:MAG: hypothetical protein JSV47_00230 [Deltaproteobacteria bacterium]|nr:MAG: hypothetical protein JSV47_00230 [Deltaproteobacteria bacterium]
MTMERPRNPFITNFCEVLMKKKGLELTDENKEKELDRMYSLYESMLGRRMVEALPEDKKAKYMEILRDLGQLDMQKIEEIFGDNVSDPEAIMKETLEEFSDIYLENR